MRKKLLFVVNPFSGIGKQHRLAEAAESFLDKRHFDFEIQETEGPGHGFQIAREGTIKGLDAVIAVGGDGSVNEIGSALINTPTALGIIPAGSGNGVARSFNIPMGLHSSLRSLQKWNLRVIDTGRISGGRSFIGMGGLGFDAHVGREFVGLDRRGFVAYVNTILKHAGRYQPIHISYSIDQNSWKKTDVFVICVANTTQYGNNAFIAPDADPADGQLDFVLIKPFPVLAVPQLALQLFSKQILQSPYVEHYRGQQIRISSSDKLVHLDGEPVETGREITFEIIPHSLKIIAGK